MKQKLLNIYRLGIKELWSLFREPIMFLLIAYTFTISVYISATAVPDGIQNAAIAIIDEDQSTLSMRIDTAFYPPQFLSPKQISLQEMDVGMDKGDYTFVINIPPNFERDVLANKTPTIQINVDATRMSQAFVGNGTIQQIIQGEVAEYIKRFRSVEMLPVNITERMRFNPNLTSSWFGGLIQIIDAVTMLSIILTGAALIRERERGTIEHLLVMPVTPIEIMLSKIWSMGLVVLISTALSLSIVVQGLLKVPVEGSVILFLTGVILHLFAMTSMAIFLATIARNMPQFGMLMILVLLPLQMLSGGTTPRESMPELVQNFMLAAPTTHFVQLGQAILFRGAGIEVVWQSFFFLFIIGSVFFLISLNRFRGMLSKIG